MENLNDWADSSGNEKGLSVPFPSFPQSLCSTGHFDHPSVPTMPPAWPPRGAQGKGSSQGPGFFRPFFLPEKSGWKIPLPGVSMAAHFRHDGAQGLLEIRRFLRHGRGSSRARRSPNPKNTKAPTEERRAKLDHT